MAEVQREAAPPKRLDLTKPVQIDPQTKIKWFKQDFEKQTNPMPTRLNAIRELAALGETDYLTNMKTRYSMALVSARATLRNLTNRRLDFEMKLGVKAYAELRKGITDEEWSRMTEREQQRLVVEANVQMVSPHMKRYDAEIRRQGEAIARMEQIVSEIDKAVPTTKIDFK